MLPNINTWVYRTFISRVKCIVISCMTWFILNQSFFKEVVLMYSLRLLWLLVVFALPLLCWCGSIDVWVHWRGQRTLNLLGKYDAITHSEGVNTAAVWLCETHEVRAVSRVLLCRRSTSCNTHNPPLKEDTSATQEPTQIDNQCLLSVETKKSGHRVWWSHSNEYFVQ